MAKYKSIVITNAGLALAAAAHSGDTIELTAVKSGKGTYDGTEVLEEITDLKDVQQTFGITGIIREGAVVKVRSVLTNEGVTDGYHLTEMGLYALDPNTSSEILYAIITAETDMADYFPPYAESPQNITLETYITATGIDEDVTFSASVIAGTYVTVQDFEEFREDTQDKLDLKPENVSQLFNFNKYDGDISTLEAGMYVWHSGSTYSSNGGSVNGGYSGWGKLVSIDSTSGFCQINNSYNLVNNSTNLWVKDSGFSLILTADEAKYLGMLSSVWHTNYGTLPTVTSSVKGLMSTSDKTKLDGILRGRLTTTSSTSITLDTNHSYLITMSTSSNMTHHCLIYYTGSSGFKKHNLLSSGTIGCSISGTTATFSITSGSETVYINYIGF